MRKCVLVSIFVTAVSVGLVVPASAEPIDVPNYSFEDPNVGVGGFNAAPPTGWSPGSEGQSGVQCGTYSIGATGSQVAYLNDAASLFTTNGLTTIQQDYVYTLTVGVASRAALPANGYSLSFYTKLGPETWDLIATTGVLTDYASPLDTIADRTLGMTVSAGNAAIGKELYVMLSGNTSGQNMFDNVRVSAVPEPGTLATMLAGVSAALLGYGRRKRKYWAEETEV